MDWLSEVCPSFTPPRRDLRAGEPGAQEVFTQRLDNLNANYESLVQMLSQRLRTAIEVSGAEGLVSEPAVVAGSLIKTFAVHQKFAETLQRPLKTYQTSILSTGTSRDESEQENYVSLSKSE